MSTPMRPEFQAVRMPSRCMAVSFSHAAWQIALATLQSVVGGVHKVVNLRNWLGQRQRPKPKDGKPGKILIRTDSVSRGSKQVSPTDWASAILPAYGELDQAI